MRRLSPDAELLVEQRVCVGHVLLQLVDVHSPRLGALREVQHVYGVVQRLEVRLVRMCFRGEWLWGPEDWGGGDDGDIGWFCGRF